MLVRINKYLADCGTASRRNAEQFILEGRIEINGKLTTDLSAKVDPSKDIVMLDGEKIVQKKHLYFLLNKPAGVVTTTSDEKKRKTVIDLLNVKEKVYPVGRLDYNTTGVLFITNDGDFANLLTHPKNNVPRVYEVKLDRPLLREDRIKLLKGVPLESGRGKFTNIVILKKDYQYIEVTSVEGRNHFIKNMFGALDYRVTGLNRKSFAGISSDIPKGKYRILTNKEVNGLLKEYGK